MTATPINPVECAQNAIRAGILIAPCESAGSPATAKETPLVKTPEEAGIARLPICPKRDRRSLPKPKQVRRYIITKKDRPDLFK